MRYKRIFVSPEFAKLLKLEATKKDKSIISYTRDLANSIEKKEEKPINKNFWRIL